MIPLESLKKCEIFGGLKDSELIVFKGEVLRDLFKKNNHIGYLVMMQVASVISSRLRNLNQQMVNIK